MKKILLTSLFLTWTLALGTWNFADSALAFEDPTLGKANAPVHMEIFDDYQCPFCKNLHEDVVKSAKIQRLIEDGTLRITFRDFPLAFHDNAEAAARAVNAFNELRPDESFAYIDTLFSQQGYWSYGNPDIFFINYALDFGVSEESFKKLYLDPMNDQEIEEDLLEGTRRDVQGTPTSFINGKRLVGAQPLESFLDAIAQHTTIEIKPVPSNNIYQGFGITAADYDLDKETLRVFWEETDVTRETILIEKFIITFDVHDLNSGKLLYSTQKTTRNIASGEFSIIMKPDQQVFITIDAYAADGVFIGTEDITVDTIGKALPPFIENLERCEIPPAPPCPNGIVYYPPTTDGCLGEPVCKTEGGNIAPLAGYEDEVRSNYDSRENPFSDIDEGGLDGKAAIELFYRGVLGGFPDGEFKGDRPVNRAEAAKFLLLTKQISISSVRENRFWDIPLGEWYTDFVLEAAFQGIIQGYADGSFGAANGIQTDEFLAMLARTFKLPTGLPHDYQDESEYPEAWFWEYAGIAAKYDLFPTRGDTLQPERALTRKEVAIAIYQYLKNR